LCANVQTANARLLWLLYAELKQTTPEEWRRVINVNLNGQAFVAMAALTHLKRTGGGALIHVSSIEALRAMPYHSAYAASKHSVKAMTEALRVEHEHGRCRQLNSFGSVP
jgi:NAD(P)-dependent dehydrogenase (short-subunit alcohol dehydrogenase family)